MFTHASIYGCGPLECMLHSRQVHVSFDKEHFRLGHVLASCCRISEYLDEVAV